MSESFSKSYADAGVDVARGYESVSRMKPLVESTYINGVIGTIGGFGGLFDLSAFKDMENPVAVSGADGVGTKLKTAFLADKHDTVGIDCVAMCVNDIVCGGARPLFFLDYIAMGRNYPERTEKIVAGVAEGCRRAGCALIGGECAEMPGFYPEDEYDLAGFAVGIVDRKDIIDGSRVKPGDAVIGLPSSGLHSNGFSLARKILCSDTSALTEHIPALGKTLGEELLTPTRIYVNAVLSLIGQFGGDILGVSHITGGGFFENIPRMLPNGVTARINAAAFPRPPIFELLRQKGGLPLREMYNTFNMGIGLAIAVTGTKADEIPRYLKSIGEDAYIIGGIEKSDAKGGVEVIW